MEITQALVKELLNYNPLTGIFTWRFARGRVAKGDIAGGIRRDKFTKAYWRIGIVGSNGRQAHRLAWLYMKGYWPLEVDHIDGNGLNNAWLNLREVTSLENSRNMRRSKANTSGTTGVLWCSGKWRAFIYIKRKQINLGRFTDKQKAIDARKAAEIEYQFHINHGQQRPL